jgi:N4-gp56 family major capsid protein
LTASDVATSAKFAQITGLLRGNSAPYFDGNSYVAVVHPHVLKDLLTETGNVGFFEASKYSQPENLFNGEVGKIFGVRFVESANVKILVNDGDANVDVYPTYVMGKEAYGVVIAEDTQAFVKPVGSSGSADPANQRGSIAFKSRFGVKMLKEESLYVLYSASSIGDNV